MLWAQTEFWISKLEIWYQQGGFGKKLAKSLPEIWQSPGLPSFVYSRYPCPSPSSNQGIRNTCRRCGDRQGWRALYGCPKLSPSYPIVAGRLHQQILQGAIRAIRWSCWQMPAASLKKTTWRAVLTQMISTLYQFSIFMWYSNDLDESVVLTYMKEWVPWCGHDCESWKSGIDRTLRNPWRTIVFDDYIWPICYKSSQSIPIYKVLLIYWCVYIHTFRFAHRNCAL